ncbi:MAG: Bug family tripartite tricarboxylate transporter substrate binding protein [Burkholderiales bacterium]
MKRYALVLCFCGAQIGLATHAFAQNFPSKPFRILSTFTAGAVADAAIRLVAQKMSDSVGQPVIVEAMTGAGGVLAAQILVRSAPDGYTLLHCAPTTLVATPFILKNPPYDPLKDFTYITHMADATLSIVVANSLPVNTVKEMIDYAKTYPGKLAYGSNGIGASAHLEMELLKLKYGIDVIHVPYKGGAEGLNAAAAGQVPMAFAPLISAAQQAKAGKVRIIAVTSVKRFPGLPEYPSMGEQLPDYEKIPTGDEIVGPAGIPAAIVRRLNAEMVKAINHPETVERLRSIGFVGVANSPEEHLAQIKRDMQIMAKAIKAARINPE